MRLFVPLIILSVPAFFIEAFVFASLRVMLLRLVTASVLVAFITEPSESAEPVISRLLRVKVVAESCTKPVFPFMLITDFDVSSATPLILTIWP